MLLYTLLWTSIGFTISKADSENATSSKLIPCNDGWFLHGDKCYKMFGDTKKLNWMQASKKCVTENGSLVIISSYELNAFLVSFLLLRAQNNAWIGLHDRVTEGRFAWVDGSPRTYMSWDMYHFLESIAIRQKEDCVEMRYVNFRHMLGTWKDVACDTELHFICQANKSDTVLSRDPRFCTIEEGEGWKYLNNCYHIVTEAKTWEDAESHCKEIYSGHLVTIVNKQTEMFVNYIISNYNENFWIGIKMRDHDIQMWSSGLHVSYEKWGTGKLSGTIAGSCTMKTRKKWEFGRCDRKIPFICEKSNKSALILKKAPEGWKCPSQSKEWRDLGGEYCYIFETNVRANWNDANYQCVRRGGTLASIHSEAETYVLQPYLKTSETVYIGLHQSLNNYQVFEWIDGSSLSYTNWKTGEPKILFFADCGEIWTPTMEWHIVVGGKPQRYVCSAKKVPPTPQINSSVPNECVYTVPPTPQLNSSFPVECDCAIPPTPQINSSVPVECDCTSGMSKTTVTGIVICILLNVFLFGIVVYQYQKQPFCKKLYNTTTHKDSTVPPLNYNYISSEIILKPDEYECSM